MSLRLETPGARRPTVTLGQIFSTLFGADAPVRFEAYDGSIAGSEDAAIGLRLVTPRAASYLATAPGSLGMARAYIQGDLEVEGVHPGDPYPVLTLIEDELHLRRPAPGEALRWLQGLGLRTLLPPEPPPQEVRPFAKIGLKHGRSRDANAIKHHYDVSNRFYEMVLGPSMTYTCACYPTDDATLEQAQEHKYDLVARKLALQPGQRLLDVGCGWGGMVRHAAEHYGVRALGVTLSKEQATWAQERIKRDGLDHLAEVRHLDYRDVPESDFDAVSAIGLIEHIGVKNYPAYFALPARQAAPRRPAAQPRHHASGQPARRPAAARVHRSLRVPRR